MLTLILTLTLSSIRTVLFQKKSWNKNPWKIPFFKDIFPEGKSSFPWEKIAMLSVTAHSLTRQAIFTWFSIRVSVIFHGIGWFPWKMERFFHHFPWKFSGKKSVSKTFSEGKKRGVLFSKGRKMLWKTFSGKSTLLIRSILWYNSKTFLSGLVLLLVSC